VYFVGIQIAYLSCLRLASGRVIVIYVVLPIFKHFKKLGMSQARYWVIKSTRAGVTIDSVQVSIDDNRQDSPWLMPSQFKALLIDHVSMDPTCMAQNFIIKRIKKNIIDATINVITSGCNLREWSCTFYGTFDEQLARSIHKNEVLRVQTQYMLIF
jgi:hypothetical protein